MKLSDEILNRVKENDLFSSVDFGLLKNVFNEENTFFEKYKNGELIYSSEKFKNAVGFIVSGEAKVIRKGSRVLVGRLQKNDVFGCQSLFLSASYFSNEIVAKGETTVLYISKAAVVVLMQNEPCFSLDYIRYLSKRIYFLGQKIVGYTGGSAESRLANFLLNSFGDYKTFELDMTMSQLADWLDIGRASLYRALDAIEKAGAVEKSGKVIRLLNREKLISFIK
ncbi:MAG: Crp/Fnr family transcriptional regulator [Acutalibacteraceae bacterium]